MKRAIITWWSTGLGRAISDRLVQAWYEVVCLSRSAPNEDVKHIHVDFTSTDSIVQAVSSIQSDYAAFDLLVLCAGGGDIQPRGSITQESIDATIALNLTSQITFVNALLELIKKNNADIVDIGATIWFKANEHMPVYSVAKWGLRGLIENLRSNLKSTWCRVIAIHPGGMDTESNVGPNWRETIIAQQAGKQPGAMMSTDTIAQFVMAAIAMPKNIEISEVLINRK